jgi:hypothetical protein
MPEFQVTCITKPSQLSSHEQITHIGNTAGRWSLTRESVIWRIDNKREAFYIVNTATGQRSYIGVVREQGGKAPYLRSYADAKWNDNLLALPDCGSDCEIKG